MSTSRRRFLKTTGWLAAGAGLSTAPALAGSVGETLPPRLLRNPFKPVVRVGAHHGVSTFTVDGQPFLTPVFETYDNLYTQFNPTRYNPVAWARQVKAGGFRYAVLTTKHHDGFCLWPTKTSEYNIAFTPYKQDVVAMYLQAFREAGLRPGFYFSWPDWWYETKITREKSHQEWVRVRNDYHRSHLAELAADYGPVDLFCTVIAVSIIRSGKAPSTSATRHENATSPIAVRPALPALNWDMSSDWSRR